MPKLSLVLVALATLATPFAGAEESFFAVSGSFIAGTPLGNGLRDACMQPELDGIDSSCFALPGYVQGGRYVLDIRADSGAFFSGSVCFYDSARTRVECDPFRIPVWASLASVSALGGVPVRWSFFAEQ